MGVGALLLTLATAPATPAAPGGGAHPARTAPSGVAVHGAARPAALEDDTVAPRSWTGLPAPRARAGVPGRVRVLVMRIHWSGAPPAHPDTGETRALMKQTATWFARASRGRHHLSSKVTPWLSVPGGSSNCGSLGGSLHGAIAAARHRGIGVGGFNRFMVMMPQCATNSQGEKPGRVTWIREQRPYVGVLVHELGHNLGLDHANSLICQADKRRITQGGSCTSQEYGDLWDAMGLSSRQYSVAVLERLGWAGRVATATGEGTWTLRDAEHSGSGLQGLRVRVSGSTSYWLEYRTNPHALDKSPGGFPITGVPGLQIRLDTGARSLRIVDASPGNPDQYLSYPDPDFVSVALPPGSSFTTPQKVRISLVSQTATTATVRVTRGKAASAPAAPTLVSAVRNLGYGGVQLSLKPPETDNGQVVLGYLATRSPGDKSVYVADPGGATTTLDVSDSHSGAGSWTVRAVNQVGTSSASAAAVEHVPAPAVTITSPAPASQVPGPDVTVSVAVTPDSVTHSPVKQVTVCLLMSGSCATDTTAPYTVTLSQALSGAEKIRATAVDESGGEGTSAVVPLSVVDSPPTVHLDTPGEGAVLTSGQTFTVGATAAPNAVTHRPLSGVGFVIYDAAGSIVANDVASVAPYAVELSIYAAGTYRIDAVATDDLYSSAPSSVHVTVVDPPPLWPGARVLRPGGGGAVGVDGSG